MLGAGRRWGAQRVEVQRFCIDGGAIHRCVKRVTVEGVSPWSVWRRSILHRCACAGTYQGTPCGLGMCWAAVSMLEEQGSMHVAEMGDACDGQARAPQRQAAWPLRFCAAGGGERAGGVAASVLLTGTFWAQHIAAVPHCC